MLLPLVTMTVSVVASNMMMMTVFMPVTVTWDTIVIALVLQGLLGIWLWTTGS